MLALAIVQRYKEIAIFGLSLLKGSDYEVQKPCIEYLIGFARGSGIRVVVSDKCNVLVSDRPYGFDIVD